MLSRKSHLTAGGSRGNVKTPTEVGVFTWREVVDAVGKYFAGEISLVQKHLV